MPLFLHLDHGRNLDLIKTAIDFGFDSVHFDGSSLSLKKNVKLTKEIVKYAHRRKVLVEGELGYLRGKSKLFLKERAEIKKEDLTKPEEVNDFVKKTKIDSLAVAVGNIHGIYARMPKLDFKRLKAIREKTDAFLVLHGGSGLLAKDFKKAIKFGIQKININTELRVAWKEALQKNLKKSKEIKPYLVLPKVAQAIEKRVEKYIKIFNSGNKL